VVALLTADGTNPDSALLILLYLKLMFPWLSPSWLKVLVFSTMLVLPPDLLVLKAGTGSSMKRFNPSTPSKPTLTEWLTSCLTLEESNLLMDEELCTPPTERSVETARLKETKNVTTVNETMITCPVLAELIVHEPDVVTVLSTTIWVNSVTDTPVAMNSVSGSELAPSLATTEECALLCPNLPLAPLEDVELLPKSPLTPLLSTLTLLESSASLPALLALTKLFL